MKSASILVFILAAALNTAALNTPHIRIRQDSNGTDGTVCDGATLVETSTIVAGSTSLELTKWSCAPIVPFVKADFGGGLLGLLGGLLGLGYWFPPLPPYHPKPPPAKHTTVTKTATATKTVTSVSVSTATATATKTDTETETATATETETSATTIVESVTDTATLTVTATVSAASPSSTFTNVCNEICTDVCAQSGRLPPISDDCDALMNAITVLNGQILPTFDVEPNHVQTITSGTCRFFFQNNGPEPLEYCWLSLAQTASQAGNACFPPVQPMSSEGLCVSGDSSWEVGAAHS
ncbi:hypothetical protein BC628DRAFT_966382 [Trametes gibbosa]|nr:hypothetical protein BC628DRAFT_966382 [Trametes gibbosa]